MTLKILMFTSLFHPVVGGSERQAQALAEALLRRGHAVAVVTQRLPGLKAFEMVNGVAVHRQIRPLSSGTIFGFFYLLSSAAALLRYHPGYHVIHVHHLYLDAFVGGLLRPFHGKPVIAKVACGGYVGDLSRLKRTPLSVLLLNVVRRLERVIAVSEEIARELAEYGFPVEKVVKIPNGVDIQRFYPVGDREAAKRALGLYGKIVSFVGRFDPQKGLNDMLRAWGQIAAAEPNALLLLLGTGPQEQELRQAASRLGITHRVLFVGPQADPRPYLEASDLFVLPSRAEGMSNVLLEAMATGLPCVATRVGGNSDLIEDQVSGFLVEPGNVQQMADAVSRLLRDPERAQHLGRVARRTVEREFSIERVANRYIALYQQLLGET